MKISLETSLSATLLPIKTVGVQVNIHNIIINKIKTNTSEKEQEQLVKISLETSLSATLLPIKTVSVQVSLHIYYYKRDQDRDLRKNKNSW